MSTGRSIDLAFGSAAGCTVTSVAVTLLTANRRQRSHDADEHRRDLPELEHDEDNLGVESRMLCSLGGFEKQIVEFLNQTNAEKETTE